MTAFISLLIISGMFLSVFSGKLTFYASVTGGIISLFIYSGAGYSGIALLAAFFILGIMATSWKYHEKEQMALEESGNGKRSAGQVVANAGVAGILGLLAWKFPEYEQLFLLMLAACFSSASSDTLSSELGNLYGKKFYNILSLKPDKKGLNGVISIEGTLFGLTGSVLIATIYSFCSGWGQEFFWIILAGTIGNFSDSVLGASFERQKILTNNWVNFSNTAIAAFAAFFLYSWFSS